MPVKKHKISRQKKKDPRSRRVQWQKWHLLTWAIIITVIVTILGVANIVFNQKAFQESVITKLEEHHSFQIDHDKLKLNIFLGEVSGKHITFKSEKAPIEMDLDEFSINFNPLYFLIGRLKINAISAREFTLITPEHMEKKEESKPIKLPDFLERIQLSRAEIYNFTWLRGTEQKTTIEEFILESKFGRFFYKNPSHLKIKNFRFENPKVLVAIDEVDQDGYFIFDLSEPRILDESRISAQMKSNGIFIAITKKPKPWLDNEAWDPALDPIIARYLGAKEPTLNQAFMYFDELMIDFTKQNKELLLSLLQIKTIDGEIRGKGRLGIKDRQLKLSLSTPHPVSLSKLPLGQSQFRTSFKQFATDITIIGRYDSLQEHRLHLDVVGELKGNLLNPGAGDIYLRAQGLLNNQALEVDELEGKLDDGEVKGQASLDLKSKNVFGDLTFSEMDALTIIRFFSLQNIPSLVSGSLKLSGKIDNPTIKVSLKSPNAGYEFLNFGEAQGKLSIENQTLDLNVTTSSLERGTNQLDMKITNVFDPFTQELTLETSHFGVAIQPLLDSKKLKGRVSGSLKLTRIDKIVKSNGSFQASDISYLDVPIGDLSAKTTQLQKHLEVKPINYDFKDAGVKVQAPEPLVFDFDETGYHFSGQVLPGLTLDADFKKESPDEMQIDFKAKRFSFKPFQNLFAVDIQEGYISGEFLTTYNIPSPIDSEFEANVQEIFVRNEEGILKLTSPSNLGYASGAFYFDSWPLAIGDGQISLSGVWGEDVDTNVDIKGKMDFNVIAELNPFIAETEKPIDLNLSIQDHGEGTWRLYGFANLSEDSIIFRSVRGDYDNISGKIIFDGERVTFQNIKMLYNDGDLDLSGYIDTDYNQITGGDLHAKGLDAPIYMSNGIRALADFELYLKGNAPMRISGKVNLTEGRLEQDIGLNGSFFTQNIAEEEEESFTFIPEDTELDIEVFNGGDFLFVNSYAEMSASVNLSIIGTMGTPLLDGQARITEGAVNILGINFEETTGTIEFLRRPEIDPNVNIVAKKEVQEYEIYARVTGTLNNMKLDLTSTPSLDRREIFSILFYGQTPDQLVGSRRQQFTETAAISQIASILSRPINAVSGLDRFLVTSRQESGNETIQRLAIGKNLTNRFSLSFTTDIGIEDPEQAFEIAYQFFDNFYLTAAKDIADRTRYRFDLNLRFESY
jgi:autotransporter translocation and assembly factor TamB